jgi:predicted SnoaL-like aldol condensation-catalyzing enzyme
MSQTIQPSTEKNKQIIRNFIEDTLNSHDVTLSTADKYFGQGPETEGFKEYRRRFWEQFPDSHTTIDHIIAEDDKVLVMLTTTGTNKQTGNRVTIKSADLYRIENGMVVEHWDVVDRSGIV